RLGLGGRRPARLFRRPVGGRVAEVGGGGLGHCRGLGGLLALEEPALPQVSRRQEDDDGQQPEGGLEPPAAAEPARQARVLLRVRDALLAPLHVLGLGGHCGASSFAGLEAVGPRVGPVRVVRGYANWSVSGACQARHGCLPGVEFWPPFQDGGHRLRERAPVSGGGAGVVEYTLGKDYSFPAGAGSGRGGPVLIETVVADAFGTNCYVLAAE